MHVQVRRLMYCWGFFLHFTLFETSKWSVHNKYIYIQAGFGPCVTTKIVKTVEPPEVQNLKTSSLRPPHNTVYGGLLSKSAFRAIK